MKKALSFSDRIRAGESREHLMNYYCIDARQFEKAVACIERIHAAGKVKA